MSTELQITPDKSVTPEATPPPSSDEVAVEDLILDTSTGLEPEEIESMDLELAISEPTPEPEVEVSSEPEQSGPDKSDDGKGIFMGVIGTAGVAGGFALAAAGSMASGVALIALGGYLAYRTLVRLTN